MIIDKNKKTIVQSHDFKSVNCTIDAEDMRYVASLLRNNYSNTQLAVIREISANALDANIEANSKRRIEVTLPTSMNNVFAVRDFGGGLSQEDVFGLYSKYGKSTKRESNNYIGAFGIGKFAPLSYGDNFTCVSYHGGKKIAYNIFVNEDDDTKIVELNEESSSEPTGLSIEVAISGEDISSFREKAKEFFEFFSKEEMPKFIGAEDNFIKNREKILESESDKWFLLSEQDQYHYNSHSHVVMGRVAYPIDRSSVQVDNYCDDPDKVSIIQNLLSQNNFYLRLPLGAVKLHHSRESLEYNKSTQKVVVEALSDACDEIQEIAKNKLSDSACLWEAKRNYAKIINAMPYHIRSIFDNAFEWNGVKINSFSFNRPYGLQDDLVLTHTWRENDSASRNGFKCRSQKQTRVNCEDNSIFLIQDIDSSHGNSLRARTLFNEDEELQNVYFIHPVTKSGENHIWNEWEFSKISKDYIKYTSNVEKEKVNRKGVKRGSRASIPLFIMRKKFDGYHRTNQSYWKNVTDPLFDADDASSIEGCIDDKVIYIPIKNYKICGRHNADYELDWAYKVVNNIRQSGEQTGYKMPKKYSKLRLYGVRQGDVKKLDSDIWINFEDFYIQFAKELVEKHPKLSNKILACTDFDSYSFRQNEEFRQMSGLLENKSFKPSPHIGSNHIISRTSAIATQLDDNTSNSFLRQAVNLLKKQDKAWVNENMKASFDRPSFEKDIKIISEDYPLLMNIPVYSYGRMQDGNLDKNIIGYIKMCDQLANNEIAVKKTA
tara:strand:- start:1768 stop:4086 length:2319 start_codon:yes stop_codon:yes gene_type:complete